VRCNAEEEAEDNKEGDGNTKGKNWLVVLAEGLASIQSKFLTQAMNDMEVMETESDLATQKAKDGNKNESPDDKEKRQADEKKHRDNFLMAQSRYQANMQMFNMMANMTATSLKSLGEGLTSIARKQ
jgi:Skp family chaperone for outer membrane proteins